jgi:hypothetical protein
MQKEGRLQQGTAATSYGFLGLTGRPIILIGVLLGLPVLGVVIFSAGLLLSQRWPGPVLPAFQHRLDASTAANGNTRPDRHVSVQQAHQGQMTGAALPPVWRPSSSAPNPSSSVHFAPDSEGWNVIRNSTEPQDFTDFLTAFPTSRFADAARGRLRQLRRLSAPKSADALSPTAHPRNVGTPQSPTPLAPLQIRYAQIALRAAGFNPGPVDGIYGLRTSAALRQFQASRHVPVTGILDATTQQALRMPPLSILKAWHQQ